MTTTTEYSVRVADWSRDEAALSAVRRVVFMEEQGVSAELEWDGLDADARHLLALDGAGNAIGTARLLPDGHIGRMAVLKPWRGHGVGTALLRAALELARAQGWPAVELSAQTHAIAFYARHGFTPYGEEFMDAGIPHRQMRLSLDNPL